MWIREWSPDFARPIGFGTDATQPAPEEPHSADHRLDDPTCQSGSIIECENQVLGEVFGIAGTPYTLNYRSDRVDGYSAGKTLTIPLTGDSVPPSAEAVLVRVEIAGRLFEDSLAPAPNLD